MFLNELAYRAIDYSQPLGETAIAGADAAAGDVAQLGPRVYDAITGDPGPGINTQNPPGGTQLSGTVG